MSISRQSSAGLQYGGYGDDGDGRSRVEEIHLRRREGFVRTQGEEITPWTTTVASDIQAQEWITKGMDVW